MLSFVLLLLLSSAVFLSFSVPVVLEEVVPKSSVSISGYAFDGEDNLHVAYSNGSIFKFSNSGASLLVQFPSSYRIRNLVFDEEGYLYTGSYYGRIYKIGLDGSYSVFASSLWSIQGMAFDEGGNLYVSAAATYQIYKITPGGSKTLFMSIGSSSEGHARSLAMDGAGNMYIVMTSTTTPPLFTYIVRVSLDNPSLKETVLYMDGVRAYDIQSLYVRPDGKLLMAGVFDHNVDEESGVYLIDPETGDYKYYVEPEPGLRLLCVVSGPEGIYAKGQWVEDGVPYYSIYKIVEGVSDSTPPTTSIKLGGVLGESGWYVSSVNVTLTAVDDASGVNRTEYSFDGAVWTVYSSPFLLDEGIYTIYYRSVDNAGNMEEAKNVLVKIDYTPPVTDASLGGEEGSAGWFRSNVSFSLEAADNLSGVAAMYYRVNGGMWLNYTGSQVFSEEGFYAVEYYSVDVAGNVESVCTCEFAIDKTPPELVLFFNVTSLDIVVSGEDNLDPDVSVQPVSSVNITGRRNLETYLLSDSAGNTLEVSLEAFRFKRTFRVRIVNTTYTTWDGVESFVFPRNSFETVYSVDAHSGVLQALVQNFAVKGQFRVSAIYNSKRNVTTVLVHSIREKPFTAKLDGVWTIIVVTDAGALKYIPPF